MASPPVTPSPATASTVETRLLATLKARDGARVFQLVVALGHPVAVVESLLRSLRARGLVVSGQEGTPPITTWRAAP